VQAKTQERARRVEVTVTSNQVLLALAGLFFLNLLLRVFYIRYDFVNGDEGVRALTAVRMLEGARLYADVVTDKPPGASLFYAAVFLIFGRSMKAVHLAATVWNFGTSIVVYLISSRLYNKRIGLWAALLFVYFSTNYFTQDTMAANTELLMALPYVAAFYFFMVSDHADKKGSEHFAYIPLIAAGLLTGLATLFKQIGVLNLAFFALYEVLSAWKARSGLVVSIRQCIARLSLIAVGFGVVLAGVAVWLKSMHALGDFWRNAFISNMFYIDSEPANLWVKFMLGRGLGFIFFNATLWTLAVWAVWRSLRTDRERRKDVVDESGHAIALWCGVSLVAVIISGRFYGHYFIPALPGLSLLAAHGVQLLRSALVEPAYRRRARVGLAMLGVLFSIALVRCHHAGYQPEQCALAAAVTADHPHRFARSNLERDVTQRPELVLARCFAAQVDHQLPQPQLATPLLHELDPEATRLDHRLHHLQLLQHSRLKPPERPPTKDEQGEAAEC